MCVCMCVCVLCVQLSAAFTYCCSVLQRVVCCSVLQCVAVCCCVCISAVPSPAVAVCCSVLGVVLCCSVLLCVHHSGAFTCSAWQPLASRGTHIQLNIDTCAHTKINLAVQIFYAPVYKSKCRCVYRSQYRYAYVRVCACVCVYKSR